MNSPPRPASPSPSTASSGSPTPDDERPQAPSISKRPLPSSSTAPLGSTKSRRKVDHVAGPSGIGKRSMGWGDSPGKDMARREEIADISFTERLKRSIGDPLDDSALQKAA